MTKDKPVDKSVLDEMTNDFYSLGLKYALAMVERVPIQMAIEEIKLKIKELEVDGLRQPK